MSAESLALRGVHKRYGTQCVLCGVDLSLCAGECVAVAGRNGSGKSTMMRIAAGLTRPDAGCVTRSKGSVLTYLPEKAPSPRLTPRVWIGGLAQAGGHELKAAWDRAAEVLSLLSALDFVDAPMGTLSKGTLQKVCVALALCVSPDVILLDEPLAGQDEPAQRALIDILCHEKQRGTALLLCCHEKFLREALADRMLAMHDGRVCAAGEQSALCRMAFLPPRGETVLPERVAAAATHAEFGDGMAVVWAEPDNSREIILALLTAGWRLHEMRNESGDSPARPERM